MAPLKIHNGGSYGIFGIFQAVTASCLKTWKGYITISIMATVSPKSSKRGMYPSLFYESAHLPVLCWMIRMKCMTDRRLGKLNKHQSQLSGKVKY